MDQASQPQRDRIEPSDEQAELMGIGGWLLLPILGLLISPIMIGVLLYRDLLPAFEPEMWQLFGDPTQPFYHPLWKPYFIAAVVSNVLLGITALFCLGQIFNKRRRLPRLMIAFYLAALALAFIDYLAVQNIANVALPAEAAETTQEAVKQLTRAVLVALIWIPYFLRSERVKNTFVH